MASEPEPIDQLVFVPFNGGRGKRLSATTTTSSAAIPGMGIGEGKKGMRVMVTNGGTVSAFIRFGLSSVVATLDSYELLPNSTQPLGAPWEANTATWFAVITETGTTTVSVCAGEGK